MRLTLALALTVLMAHSADASLISEVPGELASPLTSRAKTVFLTGTVLTITAAIFEDSIGDPLQAELTDDKPLGHFANRLGDLGGVMAPNLAYISVSALIGWLTENQTAKSRSVLMAKSSIYTVAATQVLKYAIQEPRPDGSDRYSFPSGHTSSAFSFASVVGAEHGWAAGTLAYTYATIVGLSRMNNNRHHLHDVLGGATIGLSYGLALYHYSHRAESADAIVLLPTNRLDGALISFARRF